MLNEIRKIECPEITYALAYFLGKNGVGSRKAVEAMASIISHPTRQWNEMLEPAPDTFVQELNDLEVQLIPFWDMRYPEQLLNIYDYPAVLFVRGDISLLNRRIYCVVGSRSITEYGKRAIDELFSVTDSASEIAIVSGLAYGVDSYIHNRTLKQNIGTISVVAGGIDVGFPRTNLHLYKKIANCGLVIAEFPPGKALVKGMFPMRNRIMAGLSKSVFVIEAARKSGSLITVKQALEYGRDVYAVPGSIFNKMSQGCLDIIKEGAGLITESNEVLEILQLDRGDELHITNPDYYWLNNIQNDVRFCDGFNALDLSILIDKDPDLVQALLTKMEMEGILRRNLSGKYIRCRPGYGP